MRQVVAACRDQRETGPAARDGDERRIEHRNADEQDSRQDMLEPELGCHRERHEAGSNDKPDRQASAITEEDARRRGEVVRQEAEAGTGKTKDQDR